MVICTRSTPRCAGLLVLSFPVGGGSVICSLLHVPPAAPRLTVTLRAGVVVRREVRSVQLLLPVRIHAFATLIPALNGLSDTSALSTEAKDDLKTIFNLREPTGSVAEPAPTQMTNFDGSSLRRLKTPTNFEDNPIYTLPWPRRETKRSTVKALRNTPAPKPASEPEPEPGDAATFEICLAR
ncbi:hypothetical protein T484DRAFT_1777949 [Baffinella frigidus]|nr:hypothetical protein T484DRAFT_1777949 [Cryptophyta sp. CCMP2293]